MVWRFVSNVCYVGTIFKLLRDVHVNNQTMKDISLPSLRIYATTNIMGMIVFGYIEFMRVWLDLETNYFFVSTLFFRALSTFGIVWLFKWRRRHYQQVEEESQTAVSDLNTDIAQEEARGKLKESEDSSVSNDTDILEQDPDQATTREEQNISQQQDLYSDGMDVNQVFFGSTNVPHWAKYVFLIAVPSFAIFLIHWAVDDTSNIYYTNNMYDTSFAFLAVILWIDRVAILPQLGMYLSFATNDANHNDEDQRDDNAGCGCLRPGSGPFILGMGLATMFDLFSLFEWEDFFVDNVIDVSSFFGFVWGLSGIIQVLAVFVVLARGRPRTSITVAARCTSRESLSLRQGLLLLSLIFLMLSVVWSIEFVDFGEGGYWSDGPGGELIWVGSSFVDDEGIGIFILLRYVCLGLVCVYFRYSWNNPIVHTIDARRIPLRWESPPSTRNDEPEGDDNATASIWNSSSTAFFDSIDYQKVTVLAILLIGSLSLAVYVLATDDWFGTLLGFVLLPSLFITVVFFVVCKLRTNRDMEALRRREETELGNALLLTEETNLDTIKHENKNVPLSTLGQSARGDNYDEESVHRDALVMDTASSPAGTNKYEPPSLAIGESLLKTQENHTEDSSTIDTEALPQDKVYQKSLKKTDNDADEGEDLI